MKLTTVIPAAKVNPYIDDIKELDAATQENPDIAAEFETTVKDLGKTRTALAKAAHEIDRTASLVSTVAAGDAPDDVVTVTIRLKARHVRPTKAEIEARKAAEAETAAEAPEAAQKPAKK